jgi:hypothetical protein
LNNSVYLDLTTYNLTSEIYFSQLDIFFKKNEEVI